MSVVACSSDPSTPRDEDKDPSTGDDDGDDEKDAATPGKMDAGKPALDSSVASSSDAGDSGARDAAVAADSGAKTDAGGGDSAFKACTAALKSPCAYDDKETACASVKTPVIPLTDETKWGDTVLQGGPYGAFVEWNQGEKFKNPTSLLEGTCDVLAGTFGEPAPVTADILNLRGAKLELYTVFRPACMKDGEKYPVITWGNGTCGQTGGYAALLATVASHGYVVFAANSRFTDGGNKEMLKALDFAKAVNEDSTSKLYQRLDLTRVGAMGHSQGASATSNASTDARIKSLILWNGGGSLKPSKTFLAVSGERDIGDQTVASLSSSVKASTQAGGWLFYHKVLQTGGNVTGHLTLMEQPERVTDVTVAWWNYQLKDDAEAKKQFIGTDCGLCNKKDEYEYGANNLK